MALAEAHSFGDGLIVVGSGEFVTPHVPATVFDQRSRCPSSPDGYSFPTLDQNRAEAAFFTAGADDAGVEDFGATRPKDAIVPYPDRQEKLFTGSSGAKAVVLPDTGHAITLERSAPDFRAAMAGWLREHEFAANQPRRSRASAEGPDGTWTVRRSQAYFNRRQSLGV